MPVNVERARIYPCPFRLRFCRRTIGYCFVVVFLAGVFFGVVFGAVLAGVLVALAGAAGTAFTPAFRVRIPHTDSKAFLPGVPGIGRSHTMCAWSRGSTSPSSRTSTLFAR